jgi:hypothetical protein
MSRPYSKISGKGAQKPTLPPAEIQINITGRHIGLGTGGDNNLGLNYAKY